MSDEQSVSMEFLTMQAIEERAMTHGLVYHVGSDANPPPVVEGVDHLDIGNVRVYIPRGWQLGHLIHNVFRPLIDTRLISLVTLRADITDLADRQEKEKKEAEEMRRIAARRRTAAAEEAERQLKQAQKTEQKEVPKTDVKGTPKESA